MFSCARLPLPLVLVPLPPPLALQVAVPLGRLGLGFVFDSSGCCSAAAAAVAMYSRAVEKPEDIVVGGAEKFAGLLMVYAVADMNVVVAGLLFEFWS